MQKLDIRTLVMPTPITNTRLLFDAMLVATRAN